jgi:hypothetical protein
VEDRFEAELKILFDYHGSFAEDPAVLEMLREAARTFPQGSILADEEMDGLAAAGNSGGIKPEEDEGRKNPR